MKIHGNIKTLSLYMDKRLDMKLANKVEAHIDACPDCRETLQKMIMARDWLSVTEAVKPPPSLEKEIIKKIYSPGRSFFPAKKLFFALGCAAVIFASFFLMHKDQPSMRLASAPDEALTEEPLYDAEPSKERPARKETEAMPAGKPVKTDKPLRQTAAAPEVKAPELSIAADDEAAEHIALKEEARSPLTAEKDIKVEEPSFARARSEPSGQALSAGSKYITSEVANKESPASVGKNIPEPIIIKSAEDWNKIWNIQNSAQNLSLALPEVDFNQKMVVAIPSIENNREYFVVNTVEEKDKIIVQYKEQPLQKSHPLPYQINIVPQKPAVELQKID